MAFCVYTSEFFLDGSCTSTGSHVTQYWRPNAGGTINYTLFSNTMAN